MGVCTRLSRVSGSRIASPTKISNAASPRQDDIIIAQSGETIGTIKETYEKVIREMEGNCNPCFGFP